MDATMSCTMEAHTGSICACLICVLVSLLVLWGASGSGLSSPASLVWALVSLLVLAVSAVFWGCLNSGSSSSSEVFQSSSKSESSLWSESSCSCGSSACGSVSTYLGLRFSALMIFVVLDLLDLGAPHRSTLYTDWWSWHCTIPSCHLCVSFRFGPGSACILNHTVWPGSYVTGGLAPSAFLCKYWSLWCWLLWTTCDLTSCCICWCLRTWLVPAGVSSSSSSSALSGHSGALGLYPSMA